MKEIKFRAWDKKSEQMFDVYSIEFRKDGLWVCLDWESKVTGLRENWLSPDRLELMQYTGLKDKNGVEIYEGDIIKGTWSDDSEEQRPDLWTYMIVRFGEGEVDASDYEEYSVSILGFVLEYIKGCDETTNSILKYKQLEVVGNIYQNPEKL